MKSRALCSCSAQVRDESDEEEAQLEAKLIHLNFRALLSGPKEGEAHGAV